MASRQTIEAPPAQPPRYSLLIAAEVQDGSPNAPGEEWAEGTQFRPEACGPGAGGRHPVVCNLNDAREPGDLPAVVESDPFYVWAADRCSTLGSVGRDFAARARRQLLATRSAEVAAEVWGGSLGLAQRSLADLASDVVTDGPSSLVTVFANLEAALAACYRGRRGMVHVTPQVLVHAIAAQVILPAGNQWVTATGHLVVADAGYDGSGPDGSPADSDGQWAYATSWMRFRTGPVETVPNTGAAAADLAQSLSLRVNDLAVYAQQLAMWEWDYCCHVAAEVNVPAPLVGGAS
jgi:hypothetical protein